MLPPLYAADPATSANRRDRETEPNSEAAPDPPTTPLAGDRTMATATNSSGTTVTYSNSGTAVDDYFVLSAAYLTGNWNVMANDGGGTNTVMYSLDDGTQQVAVQPKGGITFDMDLLDPDAIGVTEKTSGGSMGLTGGTVKIDSVKGMVTYEVAQGSLLYNYIQSL